MESSICSRGEPTTQFFKDLFDFQIRRLRLRGCHKQVIEMLERQRSKVVFRANQLQCSKEHLAFLPVMPLTFHSLYEQMAMVRNKRKPGITHLKPLWLSKLFEAPAHPYYIFDVENGRARGGETPDDAEIFIKKSGNRRPLTVEEIIALSIQTDVLPKFSMCAAGSRYKSFAVPMLTILDDDTPRLYCTTPGFSCTEWGCASCTDHRCCSRL